ELGRVLRIGLASVREEARVIGLLAVAPPAFERVEHRAILPVCEQPARVPVEGKQKPKGVICLKSPHRASSSFTSSATSSTSSKGSPRKFCPSSSRRSRTRIS